MIVISEERLIEVIQNHAKQLVEAIKDEIYIGEQVRRIHEAVEFEKEHGLSPIEKLTDLKVGYISREFIEEVKKEKI